jgi:hypothetical protein
VDGLFLFLHEGLNARLIADGHDILFQQPHENDLHLLIHHLVDALHRLAELPVLEAIPEEAVEVGHLGLLLIADDTLDDGSEFGLF